MLRKLFRRTEGPDWSDWKACLVYDHDGNLIDGHMRYDYKSLTLQTCVGDTVWTATLDQQREHVERERRKMGL